MKTRKIIVGLVILAVIFSIPSWSFGAKRTLPKESSIGNKIILEYEFTEPSAGKIGEYDILKIEGLELYKRAGAPIVPVRPVEVLVPLGKKVASCKAIASDICQLTDTYYLAPAQKPFPISYEGVVKPTEPNPAIYRDSKPWPGIDQEQVGTQSKRGYQIFIVNLFPLQYKPQTGKVSYASKIRLEITLAEETDLGVLRPTKKLKAELSAKVDNPSALATYPESISLVEPMEQSLSLSLPSGGPYEYVIITSEALKNAPGPDNFQALVAEKIAQGMTATIVTTEWIYAHYKGTRPDGGTDNQTRIRNFLINAYQCWGTEYVLLGGTNAIVPTRMFFHFPINGVSSIPVDMYYGCVEPTACTFDNNKNGKYGEMWDGINSGSVDLLAEIYVGRAAVANIWEVENFVYKTLTYNSTWDDGYLYRVATLGEWIGGGGVSEYATDSMEQIRLGGTYDGYFTHGFESVDDFITEGCLYYPDYCWPLYDSTHYYWPVSDLTMLMNNGMHVFNHLGHANYWLCMKIYTDDLSYLLTNNDYFFVYSQGCNAGEFDDQECFAEVITSMTHGAFAVVMNGRWGLAEYESTDSPSQRFNRQFWDAVIGEGMLEMGRANQDSKEDNLWAIDSEGIRWCYYELNLFGDPATRFKRFLTSQGHVRFEKDYYSCSAEVKITLGDDDLIDDGNQIVYITTSGGDAEDLDLTEIEPGVFKGAIYTDGDTANPNDGTIQLSDGETITVTYYDADDGSGNPAEVNDTAIADCHFPVVSNVLYGEDSSNSLIITFETDEPTYATVMCGLSCGGPYDVEGTDDSISTNHSIKLSGLSPDPRYFVIEVTDGVQNVTLDDNGGECYYFFTIHVPSDYNTIQDAIDHSTSGCTIVVDDGTYSGVGNRDIDFHGKAITVKSKNGPANCIIDCEGSRNNQHCGFYFHSNEGRNSVLDGFTITNGYGRYIPFDIMYSGGAILCERTGAPTIRRCILRNNMNDKTHTDTYGGAIGCYSEGWSSVNPLIENCIIFDNEARYGGGISVTGMSATIRNCMIWSNSANRGGGIDLFWADKIDANNCTIVNNSSSSGGGGINKTGTCYHGETITNCILWGNGDDLSNCSATYSCIEDGDSGTGNISSDPCFVKADSNDFHLAYNSPCINAGDPDGDYYGQVDIDGEPRVAVQRVDIGADEATGAYNISKRKWYKIIQSAINEASGCDKIVVFPGIYYENIKYYDKCIKLHSIDPNDWGIVSTTVINGVNKQTDTPTVWFSGGGGTRAELKGFTVKKGYDGVYCYCAHPIISNCIIEDNTNFGIDHTGPPSSLKVEINNNIIRQNNCGIMTDSVGGKIENNQICNNNTGIYGHYTTITIRNNTIVYNTDYGIRGQGASPEIYNCILWGNSDGNDLVNCTATYSCIEDCNDASGIGNICGDANDPCLVADLRGIYHIDLNSPCINAGKPDVDYSGQVDIDGQPRVLEGSVDMGADETFYPDAHWWKLDETSGTTAHDSVGTANNGAFNGNDPCWVPGIFDGAVDFNGVNDYFSVPSLDDAYNQNSVFTVAGWFNIDEPNETQTIVGQWSQSWEAGQEYYGWQVLVENKKVVARFGYGLCTPDITGTTDVNVGQWYHFAMVRNGTNVILYVNGQLKGSGTANFYTYNTKFRIGDGSYKFGGNPALKGGPFNGIIDDLMIFHRVLSAEEVEQLYQEGL